MNVLLKKNLDALRNSHPDLADKIQNSKEEKWIELKENNFIINKRNKVINAYDLKQPEKEAQAIGKQGVFKADCCTVLVGVGLGHLAHSILKNGDKGHKLIIIEPVFQLLHESFSRYDFSDFITKGYLFVATKKEEIGFFVAEMDAIFVVQDWFLITEKYIMLCEEYAELLPYAIEIINQERCNTGTVMGAGAIIAENDIKNLPYCIRHRGISELKDFYKGMPAVTVNTGPSLAKNIHLLKEYQDKVVIVAVAQALRVLLAYDIVPDFICTVDYGEVNYEHFKGLMDTQVPLIALNRTYAPILKEWQGPKFITVSPSPGFENTTAGILYEKGSVDAGGSVSHLAFGIAHHLGCTPITTIGLDLAYSPDLKSHIPQADAGGTCEVDDAGVIRWKIKDPRSSLKDKEQVMGNIQYVPGYFGDIVPTNIGLASFITSFESIAAGIKKRSKTILFDSTEGGSKKKGMEPITLHKFLKTYAGKKRFKKTPPLTPYPKYEDDIVKAVTYIKEDVTLLDNIIDNAKKGIEAADAMMKENISKEEFLEASKNNETYSNKAHDLAKKNSLIGVAIYHANRKIYSREFMMDAVNKKTFKTKADKKRFAENHMFKNHAELEKGVRKCKLILQTAIDSAQKLKPMYQDTLNIFNTYLSTKDIEIFSTREKQHLDLHDIEKYLTVGNWAHPYVDMKRCKTMIPAEPWNQTIRMRNEAIAAAESDAITERRQDILDYIKAVQEAQEIGRTKKNFSKVLKLLKKAEKLFPDKFDARWGLASAYFHAKNISKSIDYFKKLYEEFPQFPRVRFEYGVVLLEKDPQQGLQILADLMEETSEFHFFLKQMAVLFVKMEKWNEAISCYERYRKSFPADSAIKAELAKCYRKVGNFKKMEKLL